MVRCMNRDAYIGVIGVMACSSESRIRQTVTNDVNQARVLYLAHDNVSLRLGTLTDIL